MSVIRSRIVATGSYLPENVVTNQDLEKKVETSDEWIVKRTGIRQRHIAGEHEATSVMAAKAASRALEMAEMSPADIDVIIVATTSPDQTFPSTAVKVQAALEMKHGFAFDVQAVCSGFLYAAHVADSMIKAGTVRRVLVIGAEKFSSLLDWEDRTTCVLFGDGAGAVILEASEGEGTAADSGIIGSTLFSNGEYSDILYADGGPATTGAVGKTVMNGREVYRHAVVKMGEAVEAVMEQCSVTPDDLDWLVPHQANIRIIQGMAEKFDLPMDKVVVTVEKHGNTSAASIPLALDDAIRSGKIKRGDLLLMEALGAGLTWGGMLARF